MTTVISKMCAALCLVGAIAALPACGGGGGKQTGSCETGQKKAIVAGKEGCFNECNMGMCAAGQNCTQGLCIPASDTTPNNTDPNNTDPNNTDPNNTDPNNTDPNNNNNNIVTPIPINPAATTACTAAADLLYGSCWDGCTLSPDITQQLTTIRDQYVNGSPASGGTPAIPGCARQFTDDPAGLAQLEAELAMLTCDDFSSWRCGTLGFAEECGCAPPVNLGAACTMAEQCDGGDLDGFCIEQDPATGQPPGGMCVALECPGSDQAPSGATYNAPEICGAGNVCQNVVPTNGNPAFGFCRKGCGGPNTCRAELGCQLDGIYTNMDMTEWTTVQICEGRCSANSDCSADGSARCNNAKGACEFQCDGTPGPNGEPSGVQICGFIGGTCTLDAGAAMEYCVLP